MSSPLIESLRRAVTAAPDDIPLRLHLAEQLLAAGDRAGAVESAAVVLQRDASNAAALSIVAAVAHPAMTEPTTSEAATTEPTMSEAAMTEPTTTEPTATTEPATSEATPSQPATTEPMPTEPDGTETAGSFDWAAAESEVGHIAEPQFVEPAEPDPSAALEVERPTVTLADVGGLDQVKQRLEAAFLAPLRNPELRKLYSKSLRGGLLLYGPPGCGKTFIARAVAGELGAKFITVQLTDVLDPYIGNSERNVHEIFQAARREAPCVLFLDEIDALGQRRSMTRSSGMRGTVNQLLTEMDGVDGVNDGVFVLAATNQPWDVDPAMRRPGRLDRTVLVLPPDGPAREAIFAYHLRERPIEGINLRDLAGRTDGYSGADIAYICELSAERALMDSARTGLPRLIGMADLLAAIRESRPSLGDWLETARNVVLFADADGTYAELRDYLKRVKRL